MSFFIDDIDRDLWEYLRFVNRPIVLYGMGDGAEKIAAVLGSKGLEVEEIMASDDFVRGQSFLGHRVKTLSEIDRDYGGDAIILISFGTHIPDVMKHIYEIKKQRPEIFAPCVPVAGDTLFDLEFARAHKTELQSVYKMLADEQSKKVFENVIRYKLSGDFDLLRDIESPSEEKFDLLNIGTEETYVDLGAYDGDTLVEFLNETSMQFRKLYAMEPDSKSCRKLKRRLYMLTPAVFECFNCGAWSENTTAVFSLNGGRGSRAVKDGEAPRRPSRIREVKMMTVDSMLRGNEATYIKIDVEGNEREALRGAEHTIAEFKPKLNIALYHRSEDMYELPLLIAKLNKKYKFYMRHHPYIPDWDTNLYCI